MSRTELESKVFEVLRGDMALIGVSDNEIKTSIKETSDEDLQAFLEEE